MRTIAGMTLAVILAVGPSALGAPPSAPARGGTLTVGLAGNWRTLDPAIYRVVYERELLHNIFDTLVEIDPSLGLHPGLAKSWSVSADGKTITMRLQEGVLFHDGTKFDAAAVKFNLEHILDPKVASVSRELFLPVLDRIEATGPLEVRLVLKQPFTPLLGLLAGVPGMMSSPAAVARAGAEYGQNPVGTGAFRVVEWQPGALLHLRAVDKYWRSGLPYLTDLIVKPIADDTTRLSSLRAGTIDVTDRLAYKDYATAAQDASVRPIAIKASRWDFVGVNLHKAPFDNVHARRAFEYAVNRDQILQAVFFGHGGPLYGPVSPLFTTYYDAAVKQYGYQLSPAKVKEELAMAGRPGGVSFELSVPNSPEQIRLAELIKAQLADVGIVANIQVYENTIWTANVERGAFVAWLSNWTARADIDGVLYDHFASDGPRNRYGYANPRVDELLRVERSVPHGPRRVQAVHELEKLVISDAPWIFLTYSDTVMAMRARVNGLQPFADTMPRFRGVWVAR